MADQVEAVRTRSDPTRAVEPPPDLTAASIADPAPLGLAGFALTTFVLSMFNAGLVGKAGEPVVLGLALAYGGLAQFVAGMWEFRKGNTFGATGVHLVRRILALVLGVRGLLREGRPGHRSGPLPDRLGHLHVLMWVASFRTTLAINIVLLLLWVTFLLLGIGAASGTSGITKLGGWIGLATAVAAWYTSFAIVANFTFKRTLLPVRELRRE